MLTFMFTFMLTSFQDSSFRGCKRSTPESRQNNHKPEYRGQNCNVENAIQILFTSIDLRGYKTRAVSPHNSRAKQTGCQLVKIKMVASDD